MLFVEESGPPTGRAIVFVHGSGLRSDAWHYQLSALGVHRRIFYDLRGHGRSTPKGHLPLTFSQLAGDLAAVLEACDVTEGVIVGHSIGGMIALQLCKEHSELLRSRVRGVVLVSTTHGPAAETLAGGGVLARLERLSRHPFDFLGTRAERLERLRALIRPSNAAFLAVSVAGFGTGASAKQIDFTYDMLAETPLDVMFDLIRCFRHFDVTDVLRDIEVPCLAIGGTHDRLTVAGASAYIAGRLPRGDLVLLEGCGHMPMLERHDEFNELLEAFVEKLFTERST